MKVYFVAERWGFPSGVSNQSFHPNAGHVNTV